MRDIYQQVINALSGKKRILITTHVRPDGDALGSCAAMVLALRQKGVESEVLILSKLPTKYAFVFSENDIVYFQVEGDFPPDFPLERFEALLVIDTGTWSQLPGLKGRIENWDRPKFVIDHHLTQENWADLKLVVKEAAAAGEIVAELIELWDVKIDKAIATALFLAITSDTGWFQYSNTRPYTMRLAALLMEAGVDTDRMYQMLYQNERAERVALQTRAQQSLQVLEHGRLAVMRVTRQDFEETKANVPDTENLINIPLQVATVEVSILMTEPPDGGPIRVSLRSKGQVDVARFAERFGGGGHARASGLKVEATLDAAWERLVPAMMETMNAKP